MSTKKISCHDCGEELVIKDVYDELDASTIQFCPFCGSENVEAK